MRSERGSSSLETPSTPPLPEETPAGTTQSGAPYQPACDDKLCPLRKLVNAAGGVARACVPFSMLDLALCEEICGRFSEDPSESTDEFEKITITYDLTWQDLYILLTICCTVEEKHNYWSS